MSHQIYDKSKGKDVVVVNHHKGPYQGNNNVISGMLNLESTAIDLTLLISNSEVGISPTGGYDPNAILKFTKFEIKYYNVQR